MVAALVGPLHKTNASGCKETETRRRTRLKISLRSIKADERKRSKKKDILCTSKKSTACSILSMAKYESQAHHF